MLGKKFQVRDLVMLSMLTAMLVIFTRFLSFETWNMRIGFSFVPLAIAGYLYGMFPAGLVGAAADVLGMMLFPKGAYFPGFTLTALLMGMVYGFFFHKKMTVVKTIIAVFINQLALSLCLQTFWISMISGSDFLALIPVRITQCAINIPVQITVLILLQKQYARVLKHSIA